MSLLGDGEAWTLGTRGPLPSWHASGDADDDATIGSIVFVGYVVLTAINLFLSTLESVRDYLEAPGLMTIPRVPAKVFGVAVPEARPRAEHAHRPRARRLATRVKTGSTATTFRSKVVSVTLCVAGARSATGDARPGLGAGGLFIVHAFSNDARHVESNEDRGEGEVADARHAGPLDTTSAAPSRCGGMAASPTERSRRHSRG